MIHWDHVRTTSRLLFATLAALALAPAAAHADTVLSERSFWNPARTRIYTELTIAKSDGSIAKEKVVGGKVDGYAMVQYSLGGESPWVAYVREKTKNGVAFRWEHNCIELTPAD